MASANPNEEWKNTRDLIHFKELEIKNLENAFAKFPMININIEKYAADGNARHAAIRQLLGTGYNVHMRWEAKRLKSFFPDNNVSFWAPTEMASAGLYFTGVDNSMQCFCCGIVLFCTGLKLSPFEQHLHFNPSCEFLQGKDVGNVPKYDIRVHASETGQESLQAYSTEEARLSTFANWPFYARIQPIQLAVAGFYFTSRRDIVQCFSCAGCLGHWTEYDDPWKEHAKWFPECDFLISKKTAEEAKELLNSYNGFHGFTGNHFSLHAGVIDSAQPSQLGYIKMTVFQDENVRLESFKKWPTDSKEDPVVIARAGFYYTGKPCEVKCYLCGSSVNSEEHLFMLAIQSHVCQFLLKEETKPGELKTHIEEEKKVSGLIIHEVMELRTALMKLYNDHKFRKSLPFPGSSHVSIDLSSLFADVSVVSKGVTNRVLGVLTLPEIITDLHDITMIEGEAGSGKTALLKKIAILWASGSCPVLSRFSLVFYISLPSAESHQTLSDIICQQLIGCSTSLTEESLPEILSKLNDKVLFLLDDYGVMDSPPETIEKLIKVNHWNRVSLAVTVNPDKGRNLRQYARAVLGIQDFPISSSIFIFKNLFSHNVSVLDRILSELIAIKTLRLALKSPLFALCLCVSWVQDPAANVSGDTLVWRSYLMHIMLRHPSETETVNAVVFSCGELAIKSLFESRFEFTHKDLEESAVNITEALKFKILNMFTSQRLHPVFKFFHPSFQEFLAGKKMSELMQSKDATESERGLLFLQKINTISKVTGQFFYFLKYACMHSPQTTAVVISHMFSLLGCEKAFHCQADEKVHLQHHSELEFMESLLQLISCTTMTNIVPRDQNMSDLILSNAIAIANESNYLTHCAPIILSFLKGKPISIVLSNPNISLLRFLHRYPEGLWLLERVEIIVPLKNMSLNMNFLNDKDFNSHWTKPTVDEDYSKVFELVSDLQQKAHMPFLEYLGKSIDDLSTLGFTADIHRISLLTVKVHGCPIENDNILGNIMFFCSLSFQIDLNFRKCPGFLEMMWPCIDLYKNSISSLSIESTNLTMEEQELITHLTALQSLRIVSMPPPEFVLSNIHSFKQLKELVVNCPVNDNKWEIIDALSDEFKSLQNMEKIVFENISMKGHADRLAYFIEHFSNLVSFTLECTYCPGFENIVNSLRRNGKMQELRFSELVLYDNEIIHLASALPSFRNLKILEFVFSYSVKAESTKIFAEGLAHLEQLEEFTFPGGSGVKSTITHFIQALQSMPSLMNLTIQCQLLSDSSLLELGKIMADGHLRNLQNLNLSHNPDVTQSGWREFFLVLDNLPKLIDLNISRSLSHLYATDPVTFIALTHCVSRLHSLTTLSMFGWLLDDKDIEMFDSMKVKHPQSKWFNFYWKWTLPFPPIVTK